MIKSAQCRLSWSTNSFWPCWAPGGVLPTPRPRPTLAWIASLPGPRRHRPALSRRREGTPLQLSGRRVCALTSSLGFGPTSISLLASPKSEVCLVNSGGPKGCVWVLRPGMDTLEAVSWGSRTPSLPGISALRCLWANIWKSLFHTFHSVF